jgi:hypothetical protein
VGFARRPAHGLEVLLQAGLFFGGQARGRGLGLAPQRLGLGIGLAMGRGLQQPALEGGAFGLLRLLLDAHQPAQGGLGLLGSDRRFEAHRRALPGRRGGGGFGDTRLARFEGAHHMLFHGALGQLHGLGDLAVGAAVDAIEQEDLPGALGQGAQGRLDALQVMVDLQGLFGRLGEGFVVGVLQASATRSRLPSLRKWSMARLPALRSR